MKAIPPHPAKDDFQLRIVAARRPDEFTSVTFSPDGSLLASASTDGTIKLWEVSSGRLQRTLEGHWGPVNSVVFSPDGRQLASASNDNTIKLWEVSSGRLQSTLEGHQNSVYSVAFSPDGRQLASASNDRTIKLWEVSSGRLQSTLEGHQNLVYSVAFSPDGRQLASASADDTIKLWEVSSGGLQRTLEGHQNSVRSITFSPDGRQLASASADNTIKLWEVSSGRFQRTLEGHHDWVNSVAFSPNGRQLASASVDGTIKLWKVSSGGLQHTLEAHKDWIRSVAFSPDGRQLTSASDDRTIKLWEVSSGRLQRTLEGHQDSVNSVAFSSDGHQLASASNDSTIKLWEVSSGGLQRTLEAHQDWIRSVAFSPDERHLASASDDGTIKLWGGSSGGLQRTLEGHQSSVNSVVFSPDGRQLASAFDDGTIKLWKISSGGLQRTLEGHQYSVNSVAFSPNGRQLASASDDRTIKLWEVSSGGLQRTLEAHQYSVNSVAFSPDGRQLASASDDGTIKLWEVSSGRLQRTLEGHKRSVRSVAFSPDGRQLASASADLTIKLWDVAEGIELGSLRLPRFTYEFIAIQFCRARSVAESFEHNLTRLGDPELTIELFPVDSISVPSKATSYVSAKVVLIGESNVGKSCLALQFVTGRYEELGTTHGMRQWKLPPKQLDPSGPAAPEGEEREIVLWDLGGQQEYRLVNQLFLPETTLALIMFDPTRGHGSFQDVREWNLRLKKQTDKPDLRQGVVKLLVGTKLDTGTEVVDRVEINGLLKECDFVDYFPTSAKTPRGLTELGQAIIREINWESLSKTTRPVLFQLIRDIIEQHRQQGEVVLLYSALEKQVRSAAERQPEVDYDVQSVDTVIRQLSAQGEIVETRLSSGERVLVLQIGYISTYAGSLILAARDNRRSVPALEELLIGAGKIPLPGIKSDERVDPIRERIVLECTVQLMLDRGLCFKHERMLIFPTEFKQLEAAHEDTTARSATIYYDFTGAIDNIWASLVTQLTLGEEDEKGFGRVRLWKDRAEFEKPGQGVCGLNKVDRQSGSAHLDLLFSEDVMPETRDLFIRFVEGHLTKEGVTIKERWKLVCANGHPFAEEAIKARVEGGHNDIGCQICDSRTLIIKTGVNDAATHEGLLALKTSIAEIKKREIRAVKEEFQPVEVFISYSHRDDQLREELGKHLSALRRESSIGFWHDRRIGAGAEWKDEIDKHLESAGIILLLVSPDFMASDYCYDVEMKRALERHAAGEAIVIPIVLRPVEWLKTPMGKLQALPRDCRAVTSWANRDEAFLDITTGIRQAVEQLIRPSIVSAPEAGATTQFLPEVIKQPPVRILHLSDLHFSSSEDPLVRLQPLLADLRDRKEGLGINALDYLVISGDLTNRGSYEEFEVVHQFLSALVREMKLTAERSIIVPGNHDLSWDEEVYEWIQERRVDLSGREPGSYVKEGKGYLVRDDARYPRRFNNFARFHHEFKQLEYSLSAERQVLSLLFEDTGIQFLALNSAVMIDEFHLERSSLDQKALVRGLIEADRQVNEAMPGRENEILRIAVWHHPVTGNEKIVDDDPLEKLRKADFRLCLHGHIHEDRADLVGYLHPTRKLHIAGAGSFGAVGPQRPYSTPKLYNLIEVPRDKSLIRVHTRSMRKEDGAWEGWAVWPGDDPLQKRSFYEIKLRTSAQ